MAYQRTLAALGLGAAAAFSIDATVNDDWPEIRAQFRSRLPADDKRPKAKVLVLGTGWAAMSFLRSLHDDKFDITVVSPRNYFLFTPLLAGTTVGTTEPRSIITPARSAFQGTGVRYLQAEATGVDVVRRVCKCHDASPATGAVGEFEVDYDHLVVACGAQPATFGINGVAENALFMKELDDSLRIRDRITDCFETAALPDQTEEEVDRLLHFVVVGGGPSGVEFTAELHDYVTDDMSKAFPSVANKCRVTLVEALPHILTMFDADLVEYAEKKFERDQIELRTRTLVTSAQEKALQVKTSKGEFETIPFGALIWVAGISARPLTKQISASLGQNSRRGLLVSPQLLAAPHVWAIGDCAVSGFAPTAQVASQQGRYLGRLFNELHELLIPTLDEAELAGALARTNGFDYHHKGSFAYIGESRALAQIPVRWPTSKDDDSEKDKGRDLTSAGKSSFLAWRTVYFSKLLGARNRFSVATDWVKTKVWGRDISRG